LDRSIPFLINIYNKKKRMDNNLTEEIKLFYCDYERGKQVAKKILDQHLISEKDEEGNNLD